MVSLANKFVFSFYLEVHQQNTYHLTETPLHKETCYLVYFVGFEFFILLF